MFKAYYDKATLESGALPTVASDPRLYSIKVDSDVYPDHRALAALQASEDQQPFAAGLSGSPSSARGPHSPSPRPDRYPGMRLDDRRNARVPDLQRSQDRPPLSSFGRASFAGSTQPQPVPVGGPSTAAYGPMEAFPVGIPTASSSTSSSALSGPRLPSLRAVMDLPIAGPDSAERPRTPLSYSLPGSFTPTSTTSTRASPSPSLESPDQSTSSLHRRHSEHLPRRPDDRAVLDRFQLDLS